MTDDAVFNRVSEETAHIEAIAALHAFGEAIAMIARAPLRARVVHAGDAPVVVEEPLPVHGDTPRQQIPDYKWHKFLWMLPGVVVRR